MQKNRGSQRIPYSGSGCLLGLVADASSASAACTKLTACFSCIARSLLATNFTVGKGLRASVTIWIRVLARCTLLARWQGEDESNSCQGYNELLHSCKGFGFNWSAKIDENPDDANQQKFLFFSLYVTWFIYQEVILLIINRLWKVKYHQIGFRHSLPPLPYLCVPCETNEISMRSLTSTG